MIEREKIITNYIEGYNTFDVDKMIADFEVNVLFENVANGEVNMALTGLDAFRKQAEQALSYFTKRTQTITAFNHHTDDTEVDIDYYAILAVDFPNGLKKGDELKLKGKCVFKFKANNIIKLSDIS